MTSSYWTKALKFLTGLIETNREFLNSQLEIRAINKRQVDDIDQLHNLIHISYNPCFVLSTGRCGTALLTKLFEKHSTLTPYHNPNPELTYHNAKAYHSGSHGSNETKAMVDSARYELIRDTFLLNKIYVETNPRITFFAPALAELYPKSTFIHLYRHPIKFIESGRSRNWYVDNTIREEGRLKPTNLSEWSNYNQEEKIAWLWQATNEFIEHFKRTIDPNRVLTIQAEQLFKDPVIAKSIYTHIGVAPLPEYKIAKIIRQPVNKQHHRLSLGSAESDLLRLTPLIHQYYPASN